MFVTKCSEAAKRLGVCTRALRYWKREPDFPDCSKGYDIEAITLWRSTKKELKHSRSSAADLGMVILREVRKLAEMVREIAAELKKGQQS